MSGVTICLRPSEPNGGRADGGVGAVGFGVVVVGPGAGVGGTLGAAGPVSICALAELAANASAAHATHAHALLAARDRPPEPMLAYPLEAERERTTTVGRGPRWRSPGCSAPGRWRRRRWTPGPRRRACWRRPGRLVRRDRRPTSPPRCWPAPGTLA